MPPGDNPSGARDSLPDAASARVDADLLVRVTAELNDRAATFASFSVERVIKAIDSAIARWLDPRDPLWGVALKELPPITGFSAPMLREGIPRALDAFRKEGLLELVHQEIPSGWRPSENEGLLVQFLAGAVPGVAVEAIVRALLLRRPTLLKSASYDPLFPVLFARSIREVDAEVGSMLAVLNWPRERQELTKAACTAAGAVVGYGGHQALKAIQSYLSPDTKLVAYGPKLSFSCIGREVLTLAKIAALADAAAADIAWFDQQGCVAAQVIYVERGGEVSPEGVAAALAAGLARFEARLPRSPLTPIAAAAIQTWRGQWRTASASGVSTGLLVSPDGTQWTVALEHTATALGPTPLNRSVRVSIVDDISAIGPLVTPVSDLLQTVGVAFDTHRRHQVETLLRELGVCRVCALGSMQFPPAAWKHDGIGNLAPFVGAPVNPLDTPA